jgi:hypothetical protein
MIFPVAVLQGSSDLVVADLLVVRILSGYGIYRTPCRTFQTVYSLIVKTVGMDIIRALTVRLQLKVDHKAAHTMCSTLLRDKEVIHAESA